MPGADLDFCEGGGGGVEFACMSILHFFCKKKNIVRGNLQ